MTKPGWPALLAAALATAAIPATAMAKDAPPSDCGGPASDTWIHIHVNGVRNSDGLIAVTLYADNPSRFLIRHGSLYTVRVPAKAETTKVCVFVPKPGVYAFATYHDEDGSRKLNRSALGLPTEGFGFSNNPSTLAGIPAFKSVRLKISKPNMFTRISLRYP